MTALIGPNRYSVLVAEIVGVVARAELLAVSRRGVNLNRSAGAGSEDRCKRPPTQHPSHESRLPFIKRGLVHQERVVDELAVIALSAIHLPQIIDILGSVLAGGLDERSFAEGFRPCEVGLHRQSLPVGHLERGEARIVVPSANAGVERYARRQLALTAEGIGSRAVGRNGRVLHAAREVESTGAAVHAGATASWAARSLIQITP